MQGQRNRREADSLSPSQYGVQNPLLENYSEYSEDGVPVLEKKYRSFKKDGNGFRVYNAWYQHKRENEIKNDPRVIVKHVTDSPIRAHHRYALIVELYKSSSASIPSLPSCNKIAKPKLQVC